MRPRADPAAGDGSYDPTSDPRHDPAAPVTARRGGLVLPRVPWTAHGSTMAVRSPGIGPAFGPVERKSPEIGQRRGFASRPGRSRPAVTAPARCEPPSAPHHRRPAPPRPNHPASRSTQAKQLTIVNRHHRPRPSSRPASAPPDAPRRATEGVHRLALIWCRAGRDRRRCRRSSSRPRRPERSGRSGAHGVGASRCARADRERRSAGRCRGQQVCSLFS